MRHTKLPVFLQRLALTALAAAGLPPATAQTGLPLFFVPGGEGFQLRQAGLGASFGPGQVTLTLGGRVLRQSFEGTSGHGRLEPAGRASGTVNYLYGNRPEAWRTGVAAYPAVAYRDLYPGVDLIYDGASGGLKSEFRVRPGASAQSIRWRYDGADSVRVDADGSLVVRAGGVELKERSPEIYQRAGGLIVRVEGGYRVFPDGSAGFRTGAYDTGNELILDPVLAYSTYLGGSGMDAVRGIAVDAAGNAYVAGYTDSANFPVSAAYQPSNRGGVDAFVAKLNPAGTALIYCTYLGGSYDDRAFGIAVDTSGNAYVTGWTYSANFPVTSGVRQRTLAGGRDAFVAKLNAAGSALVYSTYLGGSANDSANAIAVDSAGHAYIAGETYSTNFPAVNGFQSSNAGRQDAFAAKLDAAGAGLLWSTYLGGYGDESATALAADDDGNVYLAGGTTSTNFPTYLALQSANAGGQDAYVAKLNADGRTLAFSTYLGGSGGTLSAGETATAVAIDGERAVYVAGYTSSTNFPVANAYQTAHRGGTLDGFLAKLTPGGGSLVYSTYFGGSGLDYIRALAVTSAGAAAVGGYTNSANLPAVTAVQAAKSGGYDAFVARFASDGLSLELATYLGGAETDAANTLATDASGALWIAGQTQSAAFPVRSPIQAINAGADTGFVAKIQDNLPAAVFRSIYGNTILNQYGSTSLANALGYITSNPASTQSTTGDVYVAGRNDTTCVYLNVFKGDTRTWAGGWIRAGCSMAGDPAVAAGSNGEAFVVARDASYYYWLSHYTPATGFGGWISLGGPFASEPVAARAADGSVYVIGRNAAGVLSGGRYLAGSGFLGFVQAGATPAATGRPAITIGADGAAYVAIRAASGNSIWMARLAGQVWGSWISGGGQAKTDPEVAATGGVVYAAVTNIYDQVYVQAFREGTGNGWQGWQFLNGILAKASIAASGGHYYIVGRNPSGNLYWLQSGGTWALLGYPGLASSELVASPK